MFLFLQNYPLDLVFLNLPLYKESKGKKVVQNKNKVIVQAQLSDARDIEQREY